MNKKIDVYHTDDYVYDISLDGTVVNACGMNVISNTDGFNFKLPSSFRYTEENPYISKGLGRNYPKDKSFTGIEADVAEFEDLYMNESYASGVNKMGLGIDEVLPRTINFSRKNYADLLDEETQDIKLVGNSIKSKKMPIYIEKFLDKGIKLLLNDRGKEFLEFYYDYIEKIYNMQIPLKEIASVGKIKTDLSTYIKSCKTVTKSGSKKSRQAWYELAIKHNLDVNMGDAIYYINTGSKKSDSDVKRVSMYYYISPNGEKIDYLLNEDGTPMVDKKGNKQSLTKYIEREHTKKFKSTPANERPSKFDYAKSLFPYIKEEDVLFFNCILLPNEIINDEEDHFCDETFEYNRDKYIEMFNNRIKPLLVCFSKNIRDRVNEKGDIVNNILINTPKDRKSFTEEECKLVSCQPYETTDQDTYEQLMTMDDKEIMFWLRVNKRPLFEKEVGMDWEEIVNDFHERQETKTKEGIKEEVEQFTKFVTSLTKENIEDFNGIPKNLSTIIHDKYNDGRFFSLKYDVEIGRLTDITDKFSDIDEMFDNI